MKAGLLSKLFFDNFPYVDAAGPPLIFLYSKGFLAGRQLNYTHDLAVRQEQFFRLNSPI